MIVRPYGVIAGHAIDNPSSLQPVACKRSIKGMRKCFGSDFKVGGRSDPACVPVLTETAEHFNERAFGGFERTSKITGVVGARFAAGKRDTLGPHARDPGTPTGMRVPSG